MHVHAKTTVMHKTALQSHRPLVITHTESCQSACNHITYTTYEAIGKYTTITDPVATQHPGQWPTRLFPAAYRLAPVYHCQSLGWVWNEAEYHVLARCSVRWLHETAAVRGVCAVYIQPASTVFTYQREDVPLTLTIYCILNNLSNVLQLLTTLLRESVHKYVTTRHNSVNLQKVGWLVGV